MHWERGGYVIYNKRLEQGRISHKVFANDNIVEFRKTRWDELVLLMEGISPNTRRRKRYNIEEKSEKNNVYCCIIHLFLVSLQH